MANSKENEMINSKENEINKNTNNQVLKTFNNTGLVNFSNLSLYSLRCVHCNKMLAPAFEKLSVGLVRGEIKEENLQNFFNVNSLTRYCCRLAILQEYLKKIKQGNNERL